MYKSEKQLHFNSVFAELCKQFISYKRSFGYKYNTEAYLMEKFDQLVTAKNIDEPILSKDLIESFVSKKAHESNKSAYNRHSLIREFARFVRAQGYTAFMPHPMKVVRSSFAPYIFTHDEMLELLSVLDSIRPSKMAYIRHLSYPVIFRILYGCGLRVNEALQLKITDVDLNHGVLTIKNAKFNSERIVPMSNSLIKVCRKYHDEVLSSFKTGIYFFPAKDGGYIDKGCLRAYFKKVLKTCGIQETARVHDIRHTFAVHALNKWAVEDKDLNVLLPILSTYMGHATINATSNYLRLTAEVYPEITELMNDKYSSIIPEVIAYD